VTVDGNTKFEMEAIVEKGRGFVTSERNKKSSLPVGFIPIDSIFAPVLKVNLHVEEVRVGQEINYDRLIIDVWTNGSIKPDEAMMDSARILSKHVEMFVRLGEHVDVPTGPSEKSAEIEPAILEMSLEDLELSARPLNCLKRANIKTVGDLMAYSYGDLKKLKNLLVLLGDVLKT
jgi:DNA-directed RNA polymerase subunit alpha